MEGRTRVGRHGLTLLVGAAVAFAGFGLVAAGVDGAGATSWDRPFLDLFDGLYGGLGYDAVKVAIWASIVVGGVAAVAVPAFLLRSGLRRQAAFWVLSLGGVLVLDPVLKELFRRQPLVGSDEYSFPSGNAMASVAFVGATVVLLAGTRLLPYVLVVGAVGTVLEGLGVVALFWHYPSDVVGGWFLALAWVLAAALAMRLPAPGPVKIPETRDRR